MSRSRRFAPPRDLLPVGVAGLVLLALVLPYYIRRPFWFDELVSIEIASLDARYFIDYLVTVESNMGLYHAMLAPWLELGGSEAWVRILSIGFALATLPFLYGLAARLFDRRTAVIAVLLLAVNVSFVGHARDVRGYALGLLLVTASSYFLVRAVADDRPRDWTLFALAAALAVGAHLLTGLVLVAQAMWLLVERNRVARRHALFALGGAGALIAPLLAAVLLAGQGSQLDWLERPRLRQLPGLLEWFVESRPTATLYLAGMLLALAAAARELRRGDGRQRYLLPILWLALPPLVVFALSYASPLYLYRYFLFSLPALVLLAAAGFARVHPAWLGIVLAVSTLAFSGATTVACQPDCKIRHDGWEAASAYLESRVRPGDAVVVYPAQLRTALDHYLPPDRPRLLYPERWNLIGGMAEGSSDLDVALLDVAKHRRVWLVEWWLPSEPAVAGLASRLALVSEREFPGNVRVALFGRGERQ